MWKKKKKKRDWILLILQFRRNWWCTAKSKLSAFLIGFYSSLLLYLGFVFLLLVLTFQIAISKSTSLLLPDKWNIKYYMKRLFFFLNCFRSKSFLTTSSYYLCILKFLYRCWQLAPCRDYHLQLLQ